METRFGFSLLAGQIDPQLLTIRHVLLVPESVQHQSNLSYFLRDKAGMIVPYQDEPLRIRTVRVGGEKPSCRGQFSKAPDHLAHHRGNAPACHRSDQSHSSDGRCVIRCKSPCWTGSDFGTSCCDPAGRGGASQCRCVRTVHQPGREAEICDENGDTTSGARNKNTLWMNDWKSSSTYKRFGNFSSNWTPTSGFSIIFIRHSKKRVHGLPRCDTLNWINKLWKVNRATRCVQYRHA